MSSDARVVCFFGSSTEGLRPFWCDPEERFPFCLLRYSVCTEVDTKSPW